MAINGTNDNDHLRGTAAADRLNGHGGDDTLEGEAGNDTLDGGAGSDRLFGGSGNDTYIIDSDGEDSIVDSGGTDTVISLGNSYRLGAGVENLVLGGDFFEVQGDGNELGNVIRHDGGGIAWIDGADGNDTLLGGDGTQTFSFHQGSGAYGNDVVDGGGGVHDAIWAGRYSAVVIDFASGTVRGGGTSGSGSVKFQGIERALGGDFNDLLVAADDRVVFYGADGNDTLRGGGGNDYLASDYDGTSAPQSPFIAGNDHVSGGGGNDRLVTAGGNDVLDGGIGVDTLDGGSGKDTLYWQASDALVNGGAGSDTLRLRSGNLDLTAIDNARIQNIETINMTNGGNNRLTLNASDILDISSSTNTLRVLGDSGDSVNIVGKFADEGVSGGYHRYRVGSASLQVDTDISSVF